MEFKQISKQKGFRFLIIPVPTKASPTGSLDALKRNASPQVLSELELVAISPVMKTLRESLEIEYDDLFWRFDGHFNTKSNELFGSAVSEILGESISGE